MPNDDTTTSTDAAIGLAETRISDPVFLRQMGRKEFNVFLWKLLGDPQDMLDEAWKTPVFMQLLDEDEDDDFYLIEFFETPFGPLMGAHIREYPEPVFVVADRQYLSKLTNARRLIDLADSYGLWLDEAA